METQTVALEPAASIIRRLGGPSKVAAILGVHRTRVSNWMRPKNRGGTGGVIPLNHHRAVIEASRVAGVPLGAEDLLPIEEAIAPATSDLREAS